MGNLCSPDKHPVGEHPPAALARKQRTERAALHHSPDRISANGTKPGDTRGRADSRHGRDPAPVVRQRKICILGKGAVGKSAVCIQYVEDRFTPYYVPTINHTYHRPVDYKGQPYLLTILDTAGQDECSVFLPQFSIGTHAYILVFSIDDRSSFDIIRSSIYDKITDCNLDDVVLLLVGNKADLEDERQVPKEEAHRLAQSWNCQYLECSAKERRGIVEVFDCALGEIVARD